MTSAVRSATHLPSPGRGDWKETLGRVGLVGRGVLYAVIGLLALQLAFGDAANASQAGAIEWVGAQPLGKVLLVGLTVALFAMAAWRFLDALLGDPVEGSEAKDRFRYAVSGFIYLSFAVASLSATVANWSGKGSQPSSQPGSGQSQQKATAVVLDWPGGRWLVGLAGLALIGYAVWKVKRHVVDERFMERLDVSRSTGIETFGRLGYLARSIVWAIVGVFFVHAAWTFDPNEAKGLSGALLSLTGSGWGRAVLVVVAVGLIAFGAFNLAEAKHRRAA